MYVFKIHVNSCKRHTWPFTGIWVFRSLNNSANSLNSLYIHTSSEFSVNFDAVRNNRPVAITLRLPPCWSTRASTCNCLYSMAAKKRLYCRATLHLLAIKRQEKDTVTLRKLALSLVLIHTKFLKVNGRMILTCGQLLLVASYYSHTRWNVSAAESKYLFQYCGACKRRMFVLWIVGWLAARNISKQSIITVHLGQCFLKSIGMVLLVGQIIRGFW